jgi:hypothetical protein
MKKILPIMIEALIILSGFSIIATSSNIVIIDNQPPDAPIIEGPMRGVVGINYSFTFKSTDPDGDNVLYVIDWNDGTNLEITDFYPSGEEITLNHSWDHDGAFSIMAGAIDENDLPGKPSYWLIGIGKSKDINKIQLNFHQIIFSNIFQKVLYSYLLQKLLPIVSIISK